MINVNNGMRHYQSKQEYAARAKEKGVSHKVGQNPKNNLARDGMGENASLTSNSDTLSSTETPASPTTGDESGAQVNLSDKAKSLAKEATLDLPNVSLGKTATPSYPAKGLQGAKKNVEMQLGKETIKKVADVRANKKHFDETPAILFLKGHRFEGDGPEELSASIEGAQLFDYSQKEEVINEILKRPVGQKIVLVGHGMGGDSAVEVAEELNKPQYAFRKIDLLITLDAIGMDNDFIPQNVVKNINYLGNQKTLFGLLNDGPKVALDGKRTVVENHLRPEGHDDIVAAKEVQIAIFDAVKDVLRGAQLSQKTVDAIVSVPQTEKAPEKVTVEIKVNE